MKWYAHTSENQEWQLLKDHLENVAENTSHLAKKFNSEKFGYYIGLLHDLGKYTDIFQKRLCGSTVRTDHAIIGAKFLKDYPNMNMVQKTIHTLISYPIAGHHTGLPNCGATANDIGTLAGRLAKDVPNYSSWENEISLSEIEKLIQFMPKLDCTHNLPEFTCSFWVRMLFSCLVDADFLDTELFCDKKMGFARKSSTFNYNNIDLLDKYVFDKSEKSVKTPINQARSKIYSLCKLKGSDVQGAYSLTVPTGGGKTLSSMAFALEHAKKHQLDRVIYVIPYTSIIEQTAGIFREIFGNDNIIEHHCNFIFDDENQDISSIGLKLATENWESEIILTTAVQFFESLFSHKSSRCRKLHNIVNSVVVVDEAQMLPLNLLSPSILAMRELIANYKTTFLFCTATQPALSVLNINKSGKKLLKYGFRENEIEEVIPKHYLIELFKLFKRTQINQTGALSIAKIKDLLLSEKQCLCIVNTRKQAQKLFRSFSESEYIFHLSTYMFPKHRKKVFETIREHLKNNEKCIVISTSLVECGVDISFPHVMRTYAGLDSIAQAAGRCNREGELSIGIVTLFDFEAELSSKESSLQRRIAVSKSMYEKFGDEIFSPQAIENYFYSLYSYDDVDNSIIIKELKENEIPYFNFKTIGENFNFINNNQISVIIDPKIINLEQKELDLFYSNFEALKYTGMNRKLRKFFQQYSVQVYENELNQLYKKGIVYKENDVYISSIGYDKKMGLCSLDDYFISSENFIL